MRHHVKRPLLFAKRGKESALSCCFMMLEATFHGENERILDAPWHEVQQWRIARRTALNDRRARYLSMHRAGSRVLTWDAHSDFPFSFYFLFYFHVLFYFDENTLRCAVQRSTKGANVSDSKHSLEPLPRVRACE